MPCHLPWLAHRTLSNLCRQHCPPEHSVAARESSRVFSRGARDRTASPTGPSPSPPPPHDPAASMLSSVSVSAPSPTPRPPSRPAGTPPRWPLMAPYLASPKDRYCRQLYFRHGNECGL